MTIRLPFLTQRLLLRAFQPSDAPVFAEYRSDPEVAKYQGWSAPYPLEKAEEFIASLQDANPGDAGEWYQIAITTQPNGKMIGDCAFKITAGDHRQAEIGITLARQHHGRGYATEAVDCLVDHLFIDMNLHRVFANIDPDNITSAAVLKRLGFRHEGSMVESLWIKDEYRGEDWYAVLRREWLLKDK